MKSLVEMAILAACLAPLEGLAQTQSGVATHKEYAAVLDEQNRPITAGGFVEGAAAVFLDEAQQAGLGAFRHPQPTHGEYILEAPSGGVALFDYDGDGRLDIFLVRGSTLAAELGREPHPNAALYRNNGDGTFTDMAEQAGVLNRAWGFGAVAGDIDGDGDSDLFLANYGASRLYRNNGNGTFTDIAQSAGVSIGEWVTAATFGDFNRDGRLDLFAVGYLDFDPESPPEHGSPQVGSNFCEYRGKAVMCGPRGLKGTRDFLFVNKGDGTFQEVAQKAGVSDPAGYYGFAAAFADIDDDGLVDLAVANDSTPNYLYRNRGDGTFEDISYPAGFALNEYGREQAGMGIAVGDYDGDGRLDLYLTHFSDDYNTLYRNEGEGFFADMSFQAGLGEPTIPFLGWGAGFLDFDNDGKLDLFVANGHVYPQADLFSWGTSVQQRPLLFRNLDGKRFGTVPAATGSGLAAVVSARGAAFGDLDGDGGVDVVVNCAQGPPLLLRNAAAERGNWLSLRLKGRGKSSSDAVGARVIVTAAGQRMRRDVISGGSFASHSDLRLHFGLGNSAKAETVEIRWPSGQRQILKDVAGGRVVEVEEPQLQGER